MPKKTMKFFYNTSVPHGPLPQVGHELRVVHTLLKQFSASTPQNSKGGINGLPYCDHTTIKPPL